MSSSPHSSELTEALKILRETPLQIQAQYIKDLSFENPKALHILSQGMTTPPKLAVNIEVQAQGISENHFEVILNTAVKALGEEVQADKTAEDVIFLLELSYGGVFSLPALPADILKLVLLVESPRFLFPFVRNIVADMTKESGLPPVLLAPVNFLELYEKSEQPQNDVLQ